MDFSLRNMPGQTAKIVQSEVPRHVPDFASAVANLLRRAPDIGLIGEARDKETISGCIRAALTGHLILSTVHTNSVEQTVARMADEFPKEYYRSMCASIIESLRGIVYQRLIMKRGGGRIAIMSYLVFTESIRARLSASLLKVDDITRDIKKEVMEQGLPLIVDVHNKFEKGLIELSDYISLNVELGSEADISGIAPRIKAMLASGVIYSDTASEWLETLEAANG
jgi:defect-in-organelle-trafficking protein DotB